jgi:hypothetical protein
VVEQIEMNFSFSMIYFSFFSLSASIFHNKYCCC